MPAIAIGRNRHIAWSGTKRMVHLLTETLGQPAAGDDSRRAFPSAEVIAAAGPEFLRRETGLGYRSGYVWQLAHDVAEGRLNLARWEEPERPGSTRGSPRSDPASYGSAGSSA